MPAINEQDASLSSLDEGPVVKVQPPATEQISLKQDLAAAMNHLIETERVAIYLCCQKGLTHKDTAAVLSCPVGAVKTHILRGKNKLRTQLKDWEN